MNAGLSSIAALLGLWAAPLAVRTDTAEITLKGLPARTPKGEVIRQNLKGIVLKGEGGETNLSWTDVETVNGRPTRAHLEQLKQTLKDVLCPDCRGGSVILLCRECLGAGKAARKTRPCDPCKGTGTSGTSCSARGCDKGKVECPAPCLKRSVGIWRDSPHGPARAFIFRGAGARIQMLTISEGHLGEVFEFKEVKAFASSFCTKCKGVGSGPCGECRTVATYTEEQPRSLGRCKTCGRPGYGSGWVACSACAGLGGLPCRSCVGAKSVPDPESTATCVACAGGIARCVTCAGRGLFDPKIPQNVAKDPWRDQVRSALAGIGEARLAATDRLTFSGGRSLDGCVIHKSSEGTVLAIPPTDRGDLRVLAISIRQALCRQERIAGPAAQPPPPRDPSSAPAAGPDTVVLKDGTRLNGKILIRSAELLLIETSDGKRVKVEADKIAETRSEPKAPK